MGWKKKHKKRRCFLLPLKYSYLLSSWRSHGLLQQRGLSWLVIFCRWGGADRCSKRGQSWRPPELAAGIVMLVVAPRRRWRQSFCRRRQMHSSSLPHLMGCCSAACRETQASFLRVFHSSGFSCHAESVVSLTRSETRCTGIP